ncbi:MAG: hypothetical protein GY842_17645 [bacterium]|nr:hypothetical protein [bacterium]
MITRPTTIDADHVRSLIRHPGWGIQQKFDGVYCVAKCRAGEVAAETRNGLPLDLGKLSDQFGRDTDYELHGELAWGCFYPWAETTNPDATYVDQLTRASALVERWAQPSVRRVQMWTGTDAKREAFDRAQARNIEGVIFRHLIDPSRAHRFKFRHRVDCVVEGLTPGRQSVRIGLRGENGATVQVGKVAIGSPADWRAMVSALAIGPVVVEVEYRKVSRNGCLIEPALIRQRIDKPAAGCGVDQLAVSHLGEIDGPYVTDRAATVTVNGAVRMRGAA